MCPDAGFWFIAVPVFFFLKHILSISVSNEE